MSVVSVPKLWMHYLVGVSHFAKYGTNRLLTVWELRKQRNANKCPKIAYSSVVKKMKVIRNPRADPDHHQKSITSRGSSLVDVRFRVRHRQLSCLQTEWRLTDITSSISKIQNVWWFWSHRFSKRRRYTSMFYRKWYWYQWYLLFRGVIKFLSPYNCS